MYKNIKSNIKDFVGDVKDYGYTVLYGREDVPPKVRQIVKKFKDVPIVSITINRTPVNPMIIKALNLVSQGHFGSKLEESPYDKLFHLSIYCKLQNGKTVKLEKNEVVNADVNPSVSKDADLEVVGNLKEGLTLKGLLQGGEQFMGNNKFLKYDAVHNNCQDFIMGLFKGSNIGDTSDFNFIKQDTKEFFKGKDQKYVRQTAKFVTNLGAKANEIIYGHGIGSQQIQSILFDKTMSNLTDAKKWLKKHGFKIGVDIKPEHYRFRQVDPELLTDYKTKDIGDGIKLILGVPRMHGGLLNINKKLKSLGHTIIHPQHTFNELSEGVKDAGKAVGSILTNVFTGKVDSLKDAKKIKGMHHLTNRLEEDEDYEPLSNEPNKINIPKRLKNKISKVDNMSQSDTDHEGDYSSSDEEVLGSGPHEEGDIMHRMAKLSHDIHRHHGEHGMKKRILDGYHLLGEGLKHSLNQPREIKGSGVNRRKKFNKWFKAIGSKFKTLNHNLQPIKQAATDYAVAYINPLSSAENYLNDFQREAPETAEAIGSFYGSSKQETKPVKIPQPTIQPYTYDYSGYSLPSVPVASPFSDSDDIYVPNMYGNGVGRNIKLTAKHVGKDVITAGGERAVRAIEGSGGKNHHYMRTAAQTALMLANPASVHGRNIIKTSKSVGKDLITAGGDRAVRAIEGSNVIKTSKSVAKDLINAAGARTVRAIEGSGGKNHHYLRSAAQTALMLGNPASVHGSNIIKTSKSVGKDLITAGGDRAVRAIEGSNIIKTSKSVGKDLITAGGDRAVRAIEGSGTKRGRLVKGSPEAKEWARKMREAKLSKR